MLFDTTKRVLAAMEREQVEYVIFGAVALDLHGLPRATEGLDVFIAPARESPPARRTLPAGKMPALRLAPPS